VSLETLIPISLTTNYVMLEWVSGSRETRPSMTV